MCQIAGHPMEADFDCSVVDLPARLAVVGDYDGDGLDEIFIAPLPVVQVTSGGPPPPSAVGVGWIRKYNSSTNTFEPFSRIAGNPFEADVIFSGGDIVSAVAADFDGPGITGKKQHQILCAYRILIPIKNWFGFTVGYTTSFRYDVKAFSTATKKWNDVGTLLQPVTDSAAFFAQPRPLLAVGEYLGNARDQLACNFIALGTIGNDFHLTQYMGPGPVEAGPGSGWRSALYDFDCSSSNYPARFAVVGDFDGDGNDEIAVAPDAPGTMGNDFWVMKYDYTRWRHLGLTSTGFWADFDCSGDPAPAKFAVAGDFDGDGRYEIAVAHETSSVVTGNQFWVMKWNAATQMWDHLGEVNDGLPFDFRCSKIDSTPAKFAVVGDFDGDGLEEIAVAPEASGTRGNDFWVMKWNTNRSQWENLGLSATTTFPADFDCSGLDFAARFAVAGDFDGDGRSEIAIAPDASGSAGNDFWVMKFV